MCNKIRMNTGMGISRRDNTNVLRLLFAIWLAAHALACKAQIAYSSRYYYPAGQKRISHNQIYTTNLETGRTVQLTYGSTDEFAPQYSPDGRYLAWESIGSQSSWIVVYSTIRQKVVRRVEQTLSEGDTLWWCSNSSAVKVRGGTPVVLNRAKYASAHVFLGGSVSPSGKYRIVQQSSGNISVVKSNSSKVVYQTALGSQASMSAFWTSDDQLSIVPNTGGRRTPLSPNFIAVNFRAKPPLVRSTNVAGISPWMIHYSLLPGVIGASTGNSSFIVVALDFSISSYQEYAFYRVPVSTGAASFLGYGADLSFSPRGLRYVTVTKRMIAPYGTGRQLWVSHLVLHNAVNHSSRLLVKGLAWVESVSWQRGHSVVLFP